MLNLDIKRQLFLCCYDISDTARRERICAIVKSFAVGGQYSCYECFLSRSEYQMLVRMLKASSEPGDSIVLQPVLSYEEVKYLGVATAPVNLGFTYIG
ncbi:CRISPR-associated endonuclease Cas2 [Thalassotalea ponticola]|uniref:CRISPR-associated endonuclease Cas2 n=1 Tax=Thalassotalea ponticola TaxID=1523392 RepID=UPI0025B4EA34|nr:CRISPR-associated endonuclease Cas2 [Thalassotalea ponticola]MDN3651352.1 CRISPR-associated endonuclease Cas2 [Thalassotalea ponticola]